MKRKILILSIILIIVISIVSVFVFYKVQKDNQTLEVSKLNDTSNTEEKSIEETKDENTTKEETIENTEEKIKENTNDIIKEETKEVNENTKEQINKNTNDNKKQETQKTNNLGNSQGDIKQEQPKKEEPQQTIQPVQPTENTKEETKVEEPKKETVKIDLSKYDRYENALNGGYKAYKKSDSEMSKLRGLIDTCLKELGYTNVNIIASNSKLENTQYFTANKTNVENKVYNSEDFTIYYYAEAEYHITPEGAENIFQYRSYIKVK